MFSSSFFKLGYNGTYQPKEYWKLIYNGRWLKLKMLKQATLQRLWCRRTCWWHSNSTALASCSSCLRTAGMPPIQALALALPHTSRANWGACRLHWGGGGPGTTREWQDPPVEVRNTWSFAIDKKHLSSSCHPTWISRAVSGFILWSVR